MDKFEESLRQRATELRDEVAAKTDLIENLRAELKATCFEVIKNIVVDSYYRVDQQTGCRPGYKFYFHCLGCNDFKIEYDGTMTVTASVDCFVNNIYGETISYWKENHFDMFRITFNQEWKIIRIVDDSARVVEISKEEYEEVLKKASEEYSDTKH